MDMPFFRDITLMLNAVGAGNCFLLAYSFLKKSGWGSSYPKYMLSFLLFCLGMTICNTILNISGYHELIPAFEPLNNALGFAIAPLLYLQLRSSSRMGNPSGFESTHMLWFYGFLLITILSLVFAESTAGHFLRTALRHPLMPVIWNLQFLAYLLMGYGIMDTNGHQIAPWFSILYWSIGLIWFINLLMKVYNTLYDPLAPVLYLNITLLFSLLICWLSMAHFRPGARIAIGRIRISHPQRAKSAIKTRSMLMDVMRREKYYRDPNLTIRNLSEKLGMSYNVLSQLINTSCGQNFNAFVNQFRVEEVSRALLNEKHRSFTIMGLAQRSGFNSASAFYAAFKRETGLTPKAYLEKESA